MPKIRAEKHWDAATVQRVCINHNLYTCGDNTAFMNMLQKVLENKPTLETIQEIATDILKHSKNQVLVNIMFILDNEAVTTFYFEEDEQDDS